VGISPLIKLDTLTRTVIDSATLPGGRLVIFPDTPRLYQLGTKQLSTIDTSNLSVANAIVFGAYDAPVSIRSPRMDESFMLPLHASGFANISQDCSSAAHTRSKSVRSATGRPAGSGAGSRGPGSPRLGGHPSGNPASRKPAK
jgi:hypothetical protein